MATAEKMTMSQWINATLHNDEYSTDEELLEYFEANGLTAEQAGQAVEQRHECLMDMFYKAVVKGIK